MGGCLALGDPAPPKEGEEQRWQCPPASPVPSWVASPALCGHSSKKGMEPGVAEEGQPPPR